jgi:hypothetical protein
MTHSRMLSLALAGALLAGIVGVLIALPAPAAAKPKICPEIFQPVCAVTRAGVRETYPNACQAQAAHARILHTGRCIGGICIFFKQVCARVPGHKPQTFSSVCTAEQANATVLHDGPCK